MWISGVSLYNIMASTPLSRFIDHPVRRHPGTHFTCSAHPAMGICTLPTMSLVAGRGPLTADRAGRFVPPLSGDLVDVEPHPRRVQAIRNGHTVIDTERTLLVHRRGQPLHYAFRVEDLRADPVPEAPGFVVVPGTRTTGWTAGPPPAGSGSTSQASRTSHRRHRDRLRDVAGAAPVRAAQPGPHRRAAQVHHDELLQLPESSPIAGMLSFDESRADVTAHLPAQPRVGPPR
jgi:hypothetical protein